MKSPHIKVAHFVFFLLCIPAITRAQTPFQNLNFEAANVHGATPNSFVPADLALPDWSVFFTSSAGGGAQQGTSISYDSISTGGPIISIVDANVGFGFDALQGNYSIYLAAGGSTPVYSVTISQSGFVPANAESIQMEANYFQVPFTIALDGQEITMVPLLRLSNSTLYGGDISSFAGQVENLSISETIPPLSYPGIAELDNIVFSPNSVPEPQTWTLLLCATAALALKRRSPKP